MKALLIILLSFSVLTGCYWGKTLDENKNIRLIDDFTLNIDGSVSSIYINNNNSNEYKQACVEDFKSNLGKYNLTLVENESYPADYTIVIEKLALKETRNIETVDDASSSYNGQSYELIECNVDLEFKLYVGNNQDKLIDTYYINSEKEEKLSNNRNLGDYMFGDNKDNSEYRHKLLAEDIFLSLCKKIGRRTIARASTKISKKIK